MTKTLLETWRDKAYGDGTNTGERAKLWKDYFAKEKEIYAQLLEDPSDVVSGTVKELADRFETDIMMMTGFLDGIDESLKKDNGMDKLRETSKVKLDIDPEKLYKNMVAAKADWLYNLPQWEKIFDEDTRRTLMREQRMSGTVVKDRKVQRNDPCPCGSGKKYKHCCGKNA